MVKIGNIVKGEDENTDFNSLGKALFEKNKAIEDANKNSDMVQRLYKEREAELKIKEKLLEEKADVLVEVEQALNASELALTKRMSEFREKQALERLKEDELKSQKNVLQKVMDEISASKFQIDRERQSFYASCKPLGGAPQNDP